MNPLKATKPEEQSDAIILSFEERWEQSLVGNKISCVFRKRAPTKNDIKWMYVYVGSPRKAIIGKYEIKEIELLNVDAAVDLAVLGGLTKSELLDYAEDYSQIYLFSVQEFMKADKYADLDILKGKYKFTPPQSYLILSDFGKNELNKTMFA